MKSSWLDHPGTVTVVAAVAGSIIMVVGQLFGALFPIMLGPDLSDYDLVCDPVYHNILLTNNVTKLSYGSKAEFGGPQGIDIFVTGGDHKNGTSSVTIMYPKSTTRNYSYSDTSTISIVSLHRIYDYNREIYLNVESPPGINISLSDPVIRLGKPAKLNIKVNILEVMNPKMIKYGTDFDFKYPIIIRGIGADGKERNCTMIIGLGAADRSRFFPPFDPAMQIKMEHYLNAL
jgi:hypothetical protein